MQAVSNLLIGFENILWRKGENPLIRERKDTR